MWRRELNAGTGGRLNANERSPAKTRNGNRPSNSLAVGGSFEKVLGLASIIHGRRHPGVVELSQGPVYPAFFFLPRPIHDNGHASKT